MPLATTGDVLGDLIRVNIDNLTDAEKKDRVKTFREVGKSIIAHLTGPPGVNAVAVTSVSLVVTGTSASGPGLGTLV